VTKDYELFALRARDKLERFAMAQEDRGKVAAERIYFQSLKWPKKLSKRLKKLSDDLLLSHAQAGVAYILGYRDWQELHQVTESHEDVPSAFDDYASPEEVKARHAYQTNRAVEFFDIDHRTGSELILRLRPSASFRPTRGEQFLDESE
jgi:hypothetical protein